MKNILIFTLMFVFSFGYAQKLKQTNLEDRAQQRIDRLDKNLELSETQKEKLKTFFMEQAKTNKELKSEIVEAKKEVRKKRARQRRMRNEEKAKRMSMKADVEERKKVTTNKMQEILSPEQFEKWDDMNKEKAQTRKERKAQRMENRADQIRKSERSRSSNQNRRNERR
ncbi:Spy/CpxP family protein refolding chaperone [Psychroflexus planctonicus]|nr:Spy/CpxP family protein refolding chaperone [Psychroflexus planctonicus]